MNKVVSAQEALSHITDGNTVAILGSGGGVCEPTALLKALGEQYQKTGSPRNLTLLHANGIGDKDSYGTDALAYQCPARWHPPGRDQVHAHFHS